MASSQPLVTWNSQAQVAGRRSVHPLFRPDELNVLIKVSMIVQERADMSLMMNFLQGKNKFECFIMWQNGGITIKQVYPFLSINLLNTCLFFLVFNCDLQAFDTVTHYIALARHTL